MSHKDVLKLLFPIELTGDFDQDLELEGKYLDEAEARAAKLLSEIVPDLADETLTDWERICGLTPGESDTVLLRRQKVVQKLRAFGALNIPFFVDLAELLGFTILIEELPPNVEGHGTEGIFVWRIHIPNQVTYYFRAGQSRAGEKLSWWPAQGGLEAIFEDLKPAHTQVIFAYA